MDASSTSGEAKHDSFEFTTTDIINDWTEIIQLSIAHETTVSYRGLSVIMPTIVFIAQSIVQSKAQSKVQSIVQSIVHSPGFTPTLSISNSAARQLFVYTNNSSKKCYVICRRECQIRPRHLLHTVLGRQTQAV